MENNNALVYHRTKKIIYRPPTIEQRLRYLRWWVKRYQFLYYVCFVSEIPDTQFDQMFKKLVELELEKAGGKRSRIPENSPAAQVGSEYARDYSWDIKIGRPYWYTPSVCRIYSKKDKTSYIVYYGLSGAEQLRSPIRSQ